MIPTRKAELYAAFALAVLGLVFLRGWLGEREARLRAEATAHENQAIIEAKEEVIQSRDAEAHRYTAALTAQAAAVRTPQEAARVILRYAPPAPAGTPAPQIVTVDRSALPAAVQQQLPDAPTVAVLPSTELESLAKDELTCDADRHALTACQADTADLRTELAVETRTADTWKAAAKGGTRWQRFGKVLKLTACAGAGAGVATLVHRSPAAAALGASAGVTGCSLF